MLGAKRCSVGLNLITLCIGYLESINKVNKIERSRECTMLNVAACFERQQTLRGQFLYCNTYSNQKLNKINVNTVVICNLMNSVLSNLLFISCITIALFHHVYSFEGDDSSFIWENVGIIIYMSTDLKLESTERQHSHQRCTFGLQRKRCTRIQY